MTFRGQKSSGFTLVEVLIGAALSAAVMAAVLSSYLFLGRQLTRLAHQQTLETQARRTLGQFTQDVQQATGVVTLSTTPTSPANNRLDLAIRTSSGTAQTITYYYNSSLTSSASVTINGTSVTMPAASLTRCVTQGSTVTSVTILRNITDGDTDTTDADLAFRYFDASGNPYDSGTSPFATTTNYLPGIRFISLQFITQTGIAAAGTQTPQLRMTSGRLALRNRSFLQ